MKTKGEKHYCYYRVRMYNTGIRARSRAFLNFIKCQVLKVSKLPLIPDIVASPPHLEPRSVCHYRVSSSSSSAFQVRPSECESSCQTTRNFPARLTTRVDVRGEGSNATELFTRQISHGGSLFILTMTVPIVPA